MSTINKKPFINKVIETLTDEQLSSLQTLLNGASSTIFRSYLNTSYPFTTSDKGVSHCVFEAKDKVFTGYLLYNNSYCVLVAYQEKTQKMKILNIDYEHNAYSIVDEELDINELRRVLDTVAGSSTEPVEVVANPTLAGNEDFLTGLQVGDDKYAVKAYAFPIMSAPSSTTLTDEQIEAISNGVQVVGEFLGRNNPLFMKANQITDYSITGILVHSMGISCYSIVKASKTISIVSTTTAKVNYDSVGYLNGKLLPAYPENTGTFVLKMVDGVLTWVAEV